jgi:predicted RNase H-like HicB family nuclease
VVGARAGRGRAWCPVLAARLVAPPRRPRRAGSGGGLREPVRRPRRGCRSHRPWRATIGIVTRIVHVPYAVEQDEDGVWCASAQLRPGVGAVGDGPTRDAAIADLRGALEVLLAEVGPPDELTLTLSVA